MLADMVVKIRRHSTCVPATEAFAILLWKWKECEPHVQYPSFVLLLFLNRPPSQVPLVPSPPTKQGQEVTHRQVTMTPPPLPSLTSCSALWAGIVDAAFVLASSPPYLHVSGDAIEFQATAPEGATSVTLPLRNQKVAWRTANQHLTEAARRFFCLWYLGRKVTWLTFPRRKD